MRGRTPCTCRRYHLLMRSPVPFGVLSFFFATDRTAELLEVTVAPFTFDTQRNLC